MPPASGAQALGGKGVTATCGGRRRLPGFASGRERQAKLTADQNGEIAALNDEGKTVSILLVGNEIAGAIAMRDEPRPDALAGLKALTDRGIKTVMLTGDNKRTAAAIGKQLGIEVRAELLPEDKQRIIGELKAQGLTVAKVGDGINDAPALAAADVGIAMGGGTDVALETADAAVLHGRVGDIAGMIELSQAHHGEHQAEHHGRARPQGGVPGDDHRRHHRPLARHPGRHRCDGPGDSQCYAIVELEGKLGLRQATAA